MTGKSQIESVGCGRRTGSAFFGALLCSFWCSSGNAQETYKLKPTPRSVTRGYCDAKATPALRIRPELGGRYPAKRVIL